MNRDHLAAGLVLAQLGGKILESSDMGVYALELAYRKWRVFPLRGKIPYGRCDRCVDRSDPEHPKALHPTGECVHDTTERVCHGVLDASCDFRTVSGWWSGRYRGSNIGLRVPDGLFVLDIDPRHEGDKRLAEHETIHGKLPPTLTTWSGRGDGGRHLYFQHPGGKLVSTRIGGGLDLKTSAGYCLAPPSIHPDTGQPYRWEPNQVAKPPRWLVSMLRPLVQEIKPKPKRDEFWSQFSGGSLADQFSATASWHDVLVGWTCVGGDGDTDRSQWRHPAATSPVSATTRHGCLFVYSDNAGLDKTEAGDPHGYTKFRAYAVLHHAGDLSAAARALRQEAA